MSYNETIYSGLSAHPAREVAEELHGREWPHAGPDFMDLVGAVTTLARTVEQQQREIAKQTAALVAVAREVERIRPVVVASDAGPRETPLLDQYVAKYAGGPFPSPLPSFAHGLRAMDSEARAREQLALVYEGLREVFNLGTTGLTTNAPRSYLVSMTERVRAMLDAAGKGPDHG